MVLYYDDEKAYVRDQAATTFQSARRLGGVCPYMPQSLPF